MSQMFAGTEFRFPVGTILEALEEYMNKRLVSKDDHVDLDVDSVWWDSDTNQVGVTAV